ncbi:YtxH domain-containing protein [Flavobacterium sp. LB2R40]|uniref:YtxH domain-containing protein n=1 Tax=unclassified Flavobacterium TaxID=196869 RepID=UPI003AAF093B
MKNNNLAVGILSGILVGTVLGVLFAPAKGSETRKIIANKGIGFKDILKDCAGRLSDKISQNRTQLKNNYRQLVGNSKELLNDEKTNLDNLKNMNKSTISR